MQGERRVNVLMTSVSLPTNLPTKALRAKKHCARRRGEGCQGRIAGHPVHVRTDTFQALASIILVDGSLGTILDHPASRQSLPASYWLCTIHTAAVLQETLLCYSAAST